MPTILFVRLSRLPGKNSNPVLKLAVFILLENNLIEI